MLWEQTRRWLSVAAAHLLLLAVPAFGSRVVNDETGHKLTVPDHPHRIVCLAPSVTDDAFAVGAGEDIAAISDYTRYPAAALTKPSIGEIIHPSVEKILSFHPDLVLAVLHATDQGVLDSLARAGVPVFVVDSHGMAGVYRSVASVGVALHREPEASAAVARLQARVAAVQARIAGKPKVSIFMPISFDPVFTIGRGSFIAEVITAAGGESVTNDLAQEWPQVSLEAVLGRNPQALLLMRDGHLSLAALRKLPGWRSMKAVETGRVYFTDERIDLPSPVVVDALEDLARELHPEGGLRAAR